MLSAKIKGDIVDEPSKPRTSCERTLISLINMEPGINVEGCQKWKITKCGGGNKHQFLR